MTLLGGVRGVTGTEGADSTTYYTDEKCCLFGEISHWDMVFLNDVLALPSPRLPLPFPHTLLP